MKNRKLIGTNSGVMRRQRGQTLVIFAFTFVTLMGAVGIAIDGAVGFFLSASAERAASAAALAGVPYMPQNFCIDPAAPACRATPNATPIVSSGCSVPACSGAYAIDRAIIEAGRNAFDIADVPHGVTVVVSRDASNSRQLTVQVTKTAPVFFMQALGVGPYQIRRVAIAGYKPPIQLGQPGSQLGSTVSTIGSGNNQYFLRQEGWNVTRSEGDAYTPKCNSNGNGIDIQDVHGISAALGTESSDPLTPNAPAQDCGSVTTTANRGGYNYLITVPHNKLGKVRVYNAAFAPDNVAAGGNDSTIHNTCENVKNRSGANCNTNNGAKGSYYFHEEDNGGGYIGSPNSYSTMGYTLYQIQNPFLRSNDIALTQMMVYPIDATNWAKPGAAEYTNVNTGGTITQSYVPNIPLGNPLAGTADDMHVYHDWVDIANDPSILTSKDDVGAASCAVRTPAQGHLAANKGCIESLIQTGTFTAMAGGLLPEGTYRLRVDTLDNDGTASQFGKSHKGYGVQVVDTNNKSGAGTGCDTCTVSAMGDMAIYTPVSGTTFTIPIFELPSDYAGTTVRVFIFDPGDLASGTKDINLSILQPKAASPPAPGPVATVSAGTTLHIYNRGPARDGSQPGVAKVAVGELLGGTLRPGPLGDTEATFQATSLGVTNFNGHWLEVDIPIPNSYSTTPTGQDFWYLQYSISGAGTTASDTLTLTVDSVGSPVHIVSS